MTEITDIPANLLTNEVLPFHTTKITDIPAKLLINKILPFCQTEDVLSLGRTNKFFALVANDDTFWRRRVAVDYKFTGPETARTSNWKSVYRKLRNPQVFVWGCVSFSFFDVMRVFICSLMHSRTRSIVIIQRQGLRPTWVITVSKDDLLRCSFSSRTSPSRHSCGQSGNEQ